MRALLDVNVLIALLDAGHINHQRAREWLAGRGPAGWASCPITQNGCVRIMSQPSYPQPLPAAAVIERLAEATDAPQHAFWPDDISLLDPRTVRRPHVLGPRQVTDIYLLALAVRHGGTFVTFDTRIAVRSVPGADQANLSVI